MKALRSAREEMERLVESWHIAHHESPLLKSQAFCAILNRSGRYRPVIWRTVRMAVFLEETQGI